MPFRFLSWRRILECNANYMLLFIFWRRLHTHSDVPIVCGTNYKYLSTTKIGAKYHLQRTADRNNIIREIKYNIH